ncbi:MAG TPA: outer membrane protein assembly factor BamB [Methylophilaceae bacterium]
MYINYRKISVTSLLVLLAGCSSLTDLKTDAYESMFGREAADAPSELLEFKATIQPKVLWKASIGETEDFDFVPVTDNGAVYAASASGDIVKLSAADGKQLWRVKSGEKISGGVSVDANTVLVGSSSGYVIAFDLSGKKLWKSKVSSEVLSAPKVDAGVVVVRCGDSRIYGLSAVDGSRKWVYERANPTLTLRSSAGVAVDSGAVYTGFAGGKMVALRAEDGKVIWEVSVAQPKGTTEIERIADITSLPVVDGNLVYAVAYQGRIAAVDRATGRVLWNRDISSYTGLNSETARVYVTHAGGSVYSLDFSTGKTYWRQADLKFRGLTAPLPMGDVIAFGDVQGYVHFLNRSDGAVTGRIETDSSAVMPQMTALGSTGLLLQTRKGEVYALSIK